MRVKILFILLIGVISYTYGQEYSDFFKNTSCKLNNIEGFRISSLSQGHKIEIGQTLIYEIVMYGGNEIIIKCCTEDDHYPVRFKLRSTRNGNIIYDNKYNKYLDNLNLLLDHTECIAVEISLEPNKRNTRKSNHKVRVGLAVYIENAFYNSKLK